jgi:DNA-binding winged helix-turn-helix (wHTH) protein
MRSELHIVRFGVFEVDLRAGELRRQGLRIKLQEKPFQVLAMLLEHPRAVVTREELRERLWPGDTFVDFDHSLNIAVAKLREALGDSADTPRFVETLPRRGYRFLYPVEDSGATSPAPRHWLRPRWIAVLALVLLAAGLVGSLVYFFHSQRTQALSESDHVLLADVANTTRDPVFDDTLKQALAVKLEESPFLNVVPERKVQETLRLMNRAADAQVTDATALEVCQRQNTTALLESSIASLGKQYVITLHAVNCRTGDSLAREQAEADGKETVLGALGQAASRLRAKLGESLSSIEEFDTPIKEATTSSLEALKAYSLGRKTQRTIGDAEAIPFYQRALELDPNFAMAYAALAVSNANLGQASLAGAYARKAFQLHDRVSEREKFRIVAAYHGLALGDFETENQIYQLWMQSYPRDPVPTRTWVAITGVWDNIRKVWRKPAAPCD